MHEPKFVGITKTKNNNASERRRKKNRRMLLKCRHLRLCEKLKGHLNAKNSILNKLSQHSTDRHLHQAYHKICARYFRYSLFHWERVCMCVQSSDKGPTQPTSSIRIAHTIYIYIYVIITIDVFFQFKNSKQIICCHLLNKRKCVYIKSIILFLVFLLMNALAKNIVMLNLMWDGIANGNWCFIVNRHILFLFLSFFAFGPLRLNKNKWLQKANQKRSRKKNNKRNRMISRHMDTYITFTLKHSKRNF